MVIIVRAFAVYREMLGGKQLSIEIENNSSVDDVLILLQNLYPATSSVINVSMFVVNQKYVEKNHILIDNDELALIPPVSGGK